MDKTTLLTRINKKEADIAKAKRLLEKYLSSCDINEVNIINQFLQTGDYKLHRGLGYSDAYSKAVELYESRITLQKYLNQLKAMESRESITKIDIIWKFLLQYKELVINWLEDNAKYLHQYREADSKYCDMFNSYKYTREELNTQYRLSRSIREQIHPLTFKYYSTRRGWNMDGLNKELDQDIENRYFKLINQVTKYTGEITSASGLSIHAGELNGIISGNKGSAKINTIGAGGYNIQCFHYRTLVNPVK